jgi:hypothetical protein
VAGGIRASAAARMPTTSVRRSRGVIANRDVRLWNGKDASFRRLLNNSASTHYICGRGGFVARGCGKRPPWHERWRVGPLQTVTGHVGRDLRLNTWLQRLRRHRGCGGSKGLGGSCCRESLFAFSL